MNQYSQGRVSYYKNRTGRERTIMRLLEHKSNETGRDYALRVIKDNIIHLELAPGSRVSEKELADEMGLSRTPVREALQELARTRLVEIYPQRGSTVSYIDYQLVDEARFLRSVLECAVVEIVCDTADPYQIVQLESSIKMQEFLLKNGTSDELLNADNEFHKELFQIADRMQSYSMMTGMTAHFDRVRNISLTTVKDLKIVEDHQKILDAIKEKDKVKARQLMDLHLNRYKIDQEAIQEKYSEYVKAQ